MTPQQKEHLIETMSRHYLGSSRNGREEIANTFTGSRLNPETGEPFKNFQEILKAMPEGKFDRMMLEANAGEFLSSKRGVKVTH
jgi:hypothetical protein